MDHGNSRIQSVSGRFKIHFLSVQNNLSCILGINSHDDLHQSGLSCAVLSHQCVKLSRLDIQFRSFQNSYSGERFINPFGFQYVFACQDSSPPFLKFYFITRSEFSEKCFRITIGSVWDGFVITTPSFAAFSVTKYSSWVSSP